MRRAQRQLNKKGPIAMAFDKTFGMRIELLLEHRQVGLLALREPGFGIGLPDRQRHHVVTVWDAIEHIKSIVGWEPLVSRMTEMPLAEQPRGIIRLQRRGYSLFRKRENSVVVGEDHFIAEARANRVAPGQQSGPRWRAD